MIKQIDTYRKHYLWSRKGTCLVAWETACKAKDGGLGIIDLKTQNNALLLKFLDKFYQKSDIPWVELTWSKLYANNQIPPQTRGPVRSFWWKEIMNLFEDFQTLTSCKPNKDDTVVFLNQTWPRHDQPLKDLYPQVYSFTKKLKCSLQYFIEQDISRLFSLPLSQQAAGQLEEIVNLIDQSDLDDEQHDIWTYKWGSTRFSSRKAYRNL